MIQPKDENMEFLPDIIPLNEEDYKVKDFQSSGESWECKISCKISSELEIDSFVKEYMLLTGETLKLKLKKPETEKGQYKIRSFYRCTHNTRYEETREASKILTKTPNKRFKNTFCPFQMSFKVPKPGIQYEELPCTIVIEHHHNHPLSSLEVSSFRSMDPVVEEKIYAMFDAGMTASQAYYEFIRDLKGIARMNWIFTFKKQTVQFFLEEEISTFYTPSIATRNMEGEMETPCLLNWKKTSKLLKMKKI